MKRIGTQLAAFVGLLLCSSPVWAEEQGSKTLPQLDVALFPGVLFWMAAAFITLYVLMVFVGVPGIKKTIEKRQRILSTDLEAARRAGEEATAIIKAYEDSLHAARQEAQENVDAIVAQAEMESHMQNEKLEAEMKHRMAVAHDNLAQAKETALKETQQYVNDLVQEIVVKVMRSGIELKAEQVGS